MYLAQVPNSIWWVVNTMGVYDSERGRYRQRSSKFNYKGLSDCIGFCNGRFVAFEIKTPKRRKQTTIEQEIFIQSAQDHGQFGAVVCSVEEVAEIIKELNEHPTK